MTLKLRAATLLPSAISQRYGRAVLCPSQKSRRPGSATPLTVGRSSVDSLRRNPSDIRWRAMTKQRLRWPCRDHSSYRMHSDGNLVERKID